MAAKISWATFGNKQNQQQTYCRRVVASGGSGVEREEAIMALTHWDLLSPGVIFSSLLSSSIHFITNCPASTGTFAPKLELPSLVIPTDLHVVYLAAHARLTPPRGKSPLVCFVGFRPVCKGPWERRRETRADSRI